MKSAADEIIREATPPVMEHWVLVPGFSRMGRIRYELVGDIDQREVRIREVVEINFVTRVARTVDRGTIILK